MNKDFDLRELDSLLMEIDIAQEKSDVLCEDIIDFLESDMDYVHYQAPSMAIKSHILLDYINEIREGIIEIRTMVLGKGV